MLCWHLQSAPIYKVNLFSTNILVLDILLALQNVLNQTFRSELIFLPLYTPVFAMIYKQYKMYN